VRAEHIPGHRNSLADAISRNKLSVFLFQNPRSTSPGSSQNAVQPPARPDVFHLGTAASMLFEVGLAETTRRTHQTGAQRYLNFDLRAARTGDNEELFGSDQVHADQVGHRRPSY